MSHSPGNKDHYPVSHPEANSTRLTRPIQMAGERSQLRAVDRLADNRQCTTIAPESCIVRSQITLFLRRIALRVVSDPLVVSPD